MSWCSRRDHERTAKHVCPGPGTFCQWRARSKGYLTGKIDDTTEFSGTDFRKIVPRFAPEASKANLVLVERLEENLRAAELELSLTELAEIRNAAEQIRFLGDRYPEELEKHTGL